MDYQRGHGIMHRGQADEAAMARVYQARAIADQKTSDTPGILPTPIVGQVVDLIDANRPLISSLGGAMALGGIPGSTFTRPRIAQHTTVGVQAGEKTQLPSQKMVISSVPFTKATYGGTVDISRQDIDWTSPSVGHSRARPGQRVRHPNRNRGGQGIPHRPLRRPGGGGDQRLEGVDGRPLHRGHAQLPSGVHHAEPGVVFARRVGRHSVRSWTWPGCRCPPTATTTPRRAPSSLADFRGDVLGLPRVVVPTFPAGTCVVGNSALYEVYGEVIGLLSVIEPSILGVQVAYGGYLADGALFPAGLVPLTAPAGMPAMADSRAIDAPADDAEAPKRANGGNGGSGK